ncbi:MAG: 3-dehydroquinate synthase [Bacteroidetes bacterium GWA2_30_7]|nr:MAG: 3-dehydroquinate synthase [Bacteroidetes bacterium GWA2_30_7]
MKTLFIKGQNNKTSVLIGNSLNELTNYLTANTIIITDSKVNSLYSHYFNNYKIIEIGIGEKNKTLKTVIYIYEKLLEFEADKTTFLLGFGGGIVCDITGFVATTFMRGVRFGFVATTLLSQVDASIGGKNGVNFNGFKNIVGTINQPEFVICDPSTLKTLQSKEISNGFAEIIKHALIADFEMFKILQLNSKKALKLDTIIIESLIYQSIKIKSRIVNIDEFENHERKKLNFGHTFGHAIEKVYKFSHGQAVSYGIAIASKLSYKKGYITIDEYNSIISLLKLYKLPVKYNFDFNLLLESIINDKKREQDSISFILLKKIGEAHIEKISINELSLLIKE